MEHHADAGGSGEREVGAGGVHGGVGELQLSAQLQADHLGHHVATAHLELFPVLRDHLLLALVLVVKDEELGPEGRL